MGFTSFASADSSDEWLVLQTSAGTLIAELDFEHAPQTSEQIRKWVQLGLYDSIPVSRIEPGFVVQFAEVSARATPLTASERSSLKTLALEASPQSLRHLRGTLSLAHQENQPNTGGTSFSILLASAPHLDGQFTAFGRLVKGDEVLTAISEAPTGREAHPSIPIVILHAFMAPRTAIENNPNVTTPVNETWRRTQNERFDRTRSELTQNFKRARGILVALALLFIVTFGFQFYSRVRSIASILAAASGAGFFLYSFQYLSLFSGIATSALFIALVFYFRLMSRFENRNPR